MYNNARNWSKRQLIKSIKAYKKQVELHYEKISNPEKYAKDWNTRDERAKHGLIKKWQKDMKRNEDLMELMYEILKEKDLI